MSRQVRLFHGGGRRLRRTDRRGGKVVGGAPGAGWGSGVGNALVDNFDGQFLKRLVVVEKDVIPGDTSFPLKNMRIAALRLPVRSFAVRDYCHREAGAHPSQGRGTCAEHIRRPRLSLEIGAAHGRFSTERAS